MKDFYDIYYLATNFNFDHVVNTIIEFTSQPYNAMIKEDEFFKEWRSK